MAQLLRVSSCWHSPSFASQCQGHRMHCQLNDARHDALVTQESGSKHLDMCYSIASHRIDM